MEESAANAAGEGESATPSMRKDDTPLMHAARHGLVTDVAAALAGGADVNETSPMS